LRRRAPRGVEGAGRTSRDSVVSTLRTDETAALAAAMIIAGSFPDIATFAARIAGAPNGPPNAPKLQRAAKRRNGHGGRCGARRETPDQCDERLTAAMRANPGANIAVLATAIGKSRTSTVSALHRPRDAGLAENLDRVWMLVEPAEPKPTPKWIAPVSVQRRRVETEEREQV
jgi:hypothetical protein